jgi:hypothetical protein
VPLDGRLDLIRLLPARANRQPVRAAYVQESPAEPLRALRDHGFRRGRPPWPAPGFRASPASPTIRSCSKSSSFPPSSTDAADPAARLDYQKSRLCKARRVARTRYEPAAASTSSSCGRPNDRFPGSRRAANARNRTYAIMRKSGARSPQGRINRAITRPSSSIVVSLEQACHAGGRGFESRRSRKSPANPHMYLT